MSPYRPLFAEITGAVSLRYPTGLRWFGRPVTRLPGRVTRAISHETARAYLEIQLRNTLYDNVYVRGVVTPDASLERVRADPAEAGPFLNELIAAHPHSGCESVGWRTVSEGDGFRVAQRGGLRLWLYPGEAELTSQPENAASQSVSVRMPNGLLGMSPGFYLVQGPMEFAVDKVPRVARFYWNLRPAAAARFVRISYSSLSKLGVQFSLKVLLDPAQYRRCDAGVLYVAVADLPALMGSIASIYSQLKSELDPGTTAFTKRLAPGLGAAEEPGSGQSFGQHICGLISAGILRAKDEGVRHIDDRVEVVYRCLEDAGVQVDRPFLAPGRTTDPFPNLELPPRLPKAAARQASNAPDYADVALAIGETISNTAIWHEERCTWMANTTDDDASHTGQPNRRYAALSPDLYSGLSGVALFLSELSRVSDAPTFRRTARAAMRQALWLAERQPPSIGLYTGSLGVALTAALVGERMGESDLVERANSLALACDSLEPTRGAFDLVDGCAGACVAFLCLERLLGRPEFRSEASRLGQHLIDSGCRRPTGLSWAGRWHQPHPDLTGLAHGTSGAVLALLELFAANGDDALLDTARQALEYERRWFDTNERNWVDLRHVRDNAKPGEASQPCATAWCHGAPGMALSRLRAAEILDDVTLLEEARVGLETTSEYLHDHLGDDDPGFSLCHGLAGNADILAWAWRRLDIEEPDIVWAVAREGIARQSQEEPWSDGEGPMETPGLMTGLSGVGLFYLRLHVPETPFVLLPTTWVT